MEKTLSESKEVGAWLEFFDDEEREAMARMLDEVLLVTRNDLITGLTELIVSSGKEGVVRAFYAERPIKTVFGKIPCFFPNSRNGRAKGVGVPPITVDPRDQEVGSEGIISSFITDYCRATEFDVLNHPGPGKLRNSKVREIVLITDFIGSGARISKMLESFRYVATLRSWRSYKLLKFVVIAYSGTSTGIQLVQSHKLKPDVRVFIGCPSIKNSFKGRLRATMLRLCKSYPTGHGDPLGFGGSGALVAFAHGCPNNVPPVFHSRSAGWTPLFRGRSTSAYHADFFDVDTSKIELQKAPALRKVKAARQKLDGNDRTWVSIISVLSAIENGASNDNEISANTRQPIDQVLELVSVAKQALWIDENRQLTKLGQSELIRLRRRRSRSPIVAENEGGLYYPTQLRDS